MSEFDSFVERHGFRKIGERYAGVYADMHLTLLMEEQQLNAHLYLDLPGAGKREKLFEIFREKSQRYGVSVSESENKNVIRFLFDNPLNAVSRMERFLSECDNDIRPYGREMGILCAKCRSEIQQDALEYTETDGEILPICKACINDPDRKIGKNENRRTNASKRAKKGMLGACTGMLAAAVLWGVFTYFGVYSYYIPAMAIALIVDYFYVRFGGISDKWRFWVVFLFSALAILLGYTGSMMISTYEYYKAIMDSVSALGEEARVFYESFSFADAFSSVFHIKQTMIALFPSWIFAAIGAFVSARGDFFRKKM
ncbi:MAG: hypothetical protein IJC48_07405 [Clostridia bacterium]|nr:hypothetical protein [Clostridia bacterium]MBQ4157536.1 hypothetical protein [Clostridia bacterium]